VNVTVTVGDIADAPAEAICTSTNPRLTLMMGTGAAVRERGGFEVLRACEAVVAAHRQKTGRDELPVGSVHVTTAGKLPARIAIHCVVSGRGHLSSPEIIRVVVLRALAAAERHGCASIAMPLFGTGHARVGPGPAVEAMLEAIRRSGSALRVTIVAADAATAEVVRSAAG
jgi:O-acetyl-ADP-ribose deacetylase (regulator of RNase III)